MWLSAAVMSNLNYLNDVFASDTIVSESSMLRPTDAKRIAAMRRALVRLSAAGTRAVSLSFLDRTEVEGLRGMAAMQSFCTATPSIEYRGNSVRQDFDVCFLTC